jgi:hypothetical protein
VGAVAQALGIIDQTGRHLVKYAVRIVVQEVARAEMTERCHVAYPAGRATPTSIALSRNALH